MPPLQSSCQYDRFQNSSINVTEEPTSELWIVIVQSRSVVWKDVRLIVSLYVRRNRKRYLAGSVEEVPVIGRVAGQPGRPRSQDPKAARSGR
jgi:hypothetical protein